MVWRLPLAVGVALLAVVSLRGFLLVELPFGRYTTTGHSPYVLLPMVSKFGWGGRATVSFIAGWSWLWREVAGGESLGTLLIF